MPLVRRGRAIGSGQMTPGKRLAVITIPTARISAALTAGSVRTSRAVQRETPERTLRKDGDEADRGDRRGEADAEGDDQGEAEADPMERDRREQDDERRRARQEASRNAHAEDSLRGEASS